MSFGPAPKQTSTPVIGSMKGAVTNTPVIGLTRGVRDLDIDLDLDFSKTGRDHGKNGAAGQQRSWTSLDQVSDKSGHTGVGGY